MVSNNLIKGIAIGGLIGAGMGMLFAPKSGKETREQIRDSAKEVFDKAKAQYEEAARKLETLKAHKKEMFAHKKDRLKMALDAGREAYKQETLAKQDGACMTGLYGDNSLI